MKEIIRIINGIKIGYLAIKNPFIVNNYRLLADLAELILKTAKKHRPHMAHIAMIHHDIDGEEKIITLWAGPTIKDDPYTRIDELNKQNQILIKALRDKSES